MCGVQRRFEMIIILQCDFHLCGRAIGAKKGNRSKHIEKWNWTLTINSRLSVCETTYILYIYINIYTFHKEVPKYIIKWILRRRQGVNAFRSVCNDDDYIGGLECAPRSYFTRMRKTEQQIKWWMKPHAIIVFAHIVKTNILKRLNKSRTIRILSVLAVPWCATRCCTVLYWTVLCCSNL